MNLESLQGKTYLPIVFDSSGTFTIVNNGTAAAPCRLTIVPQNDVMQMEIVGLSDQPITILRVQRNTVLVIDGINRTVTKDDVNAFNDYDGWEFPRLLPGENEISITDAATATVNIQYQPRYI